MELFAADVLGNQHIDDVEATLADRRVRLIRSVNPHQGRPKLIANIASALADRTQLRRRQFDHLEHEGAQFSGRIVQPVEEVGPPPIIVD